MRKKVVFLDIDGTLTIPGQNEPPASALEAIRRAQALGHYIFLCSGRNYGMLKPLLQYGFDGYVASSGGYIVCNDQIIYDSPMTKEQSDFASEVLKRNGIFRTVECRDGSFTDEGFKTFLKETAEAKGEGNSELLRWREQIESSLNIRPMEEYNGQPIYKMVMMAPTEESLTEPKELLKDILNVVILGKEQDAFINGELVGKDFDKGLAVERVCAYLNIPVEDSVGFGDSMNDREMLEKVGYSVCMENGTEEMKKLADHVCPAVEQDGLYQGFEVCGLMRE